MTKNFKDPFARVSLGDFKHQQSARAPKVKRIARAQLLERVSKFGNAKYNLGAEPVMELTARHPYDPAGFMDFYEPGRWDCEVNLVFMDTIRATGPSPGMWEGTAGYARFKAPTNGAYLVVGNFSGYQVTFNLMGPWGTNTAYCSVTSNSESALALWTGALGETLFFTFHFTGPYLGYLESIQIFPLS